jgi:hypothetical protein
MLDTNEHKTFDEFVTWLGENKWLSIKTMSDVYLFTKGIDKSPIILKSAGNTIARILENLNLRSNTRDVLIKIQHAIDLELTKLGGGI